MIALHSENIFDFYKTPDTGAGTLSMRSNKNGRDNVTGSPDYDTNSMVLTMKLVAGESIYFQFQYPNACTITNIYFSTHFLG